MKAPNPITADNLEAHVESWGTRAWAIERCPKCGVSKWIRFRRHPEYSRRLTVVHDTRCACVDAEPLCWVWGWERLATLLNERSEEERDKAWEELTHGSD